MLPLFSLGAAGSKSDSIAASIDTLMKLYPKANLLDIYKSSFQNRYGPGHIIADPAKSKAYLDRELTETPRHKNPDYEPTVYDGSFIRVNLSVISDSIVPYDTFFDAFLLSAKNTVMPPIEKWTDEWHEILTVVKEQYPDLPGLYDDEKAIEGRLQKGIYQGEHSDLYMEEYDPHYRIIRRDVFEAKIKPIIDNKQK